MDLRPFYKVTETTKPEKLRSIPTIEQLEKYYNFLAQYREGGWLSDRNLEDTCADRMAAIRGEIESRRLEEHSKRQHGEAMSLGEQTLKTSSQTLCWTKVAAVAAIVGVIVTLILGIAQIWLSNTGTSKAVRASPMSSPRTITPKSESPVPAATASISTP
jgi:hypothetical protein